MALICDTCGGYLSNYICWEDDCMEFGVEQDGIEEDE